MFSPEFMKFLINYQKEDFTPEETKKEIEFKDKRGKGKLAEVFLTVEKQPTFSVMLIYTFFKCSIFNSGLRVMPITSMRCFWNLCS